MKIEEYEEENLKNNKSDKYIYLTPIKIQPTSDEKPIFLLKKYKKTKGKPIFSLKNT